MVPLAVIRLGGTVTAPSASSSRWTSRTNIASIAWQIRDEMSADTSSILAIDSSRSRLEPLAAAGFDRSIRGARSIPIGQGFAGAVAQTRVPTILTEVNSSTVLNPVLISQGVQALLGVPIMAESELLGVLHVGQVSARVFTEDDAVLLTEIAKDLGSYIKHTQREDGQSAALALQRSLLPATFRVPPTLEIAVRYIPAEGELGGDWYDAFELPDQRLAIVIGDVVGHGLEAAIVMGRLRSTVRAFAMRGNDPADILTYVDEEITHFEPGKLATILLGISQPPYTDWTFSSAGHHPPSIATAGEECRSLDMTPGMLIGVNPRTQRTNTTVHLPHGSLLCFFTDGLVERRPGPSDGDRDIVGENIALLCKSLVAHEDPEAACMKALTEILGDIVTEDDVALLIAKINPPD